MAWKGTPAEKRAWAIKKAKERQSQAERRGAKPLPGYSVPAHEHACEPRDIKQEEIIPGSSTVSKALCTVCGRTWTRTRNSRGFPELKVVPLTKKKPSQ